MKQQGKIAVVSIFPLHCLSSLGGRFCPEGHYATWLPQIAEAWKDQADFEIHWLTGSDLVGRAMTCSEWNQTFHIYPIAKRGRAASFYRDDRREIQKILAEINPDLVHAWGTEDVCGFAGVRSGYPCILSMQGIHTTLIWHGVHHPRVYFQTALEAYCLNRADIVTVESEWGKKKIGPYRGGRPIEIVEYGVHPRFFEARWDPVAQPPTFLFVGTVCPQKGIEDCLAAFRDPRLADAKLKVYGSGNPRYLQKLKASSPANVEWMGRQPPEVLVAAYEKASALILPTRADTSPNVVKEARVVGLPVITSPEGGQAAYVFDDVDGFIVPNGIIELLVERISVLAKDSDRLKKMGNLGKIRYRENLSAEKTCQILLQVYRHLMRENKQC